MLIPVLGILQYMYNDVYLYQYPITAFLNYCSDPVVLFNCGESDLTLCDGSASVPRGLTSGVINPASDSMPEPSECSGTIWLEDRPPPAACSGSEPFV